MNSLYCADDWLRLVTEAPSPGDAYRTPSRKDYARLLHSAAWRRMQGKTQLFPGLDSEFFRNRLTHSLEVAQIAKSIALRLNSSDALVSKDQVWRIDTDLMEFSGLAHDLGHPPFGHEGETALDCEMRQSGGFEGNAQTLRILAFLEEKVRASSSDGAPEQSVGLNLTMRSLAAVLKYDHEIPSVRGPKKGDDDGVVKGYYAEESELVASIKASVSQAEPDPSVPFKTIECNIMDVADDIAYSTYDLEDAMKAGFRTPLDLIAPDPDILSQVVARTNKNLAKEGISPIDETRAKKLLAEIALLAELGGELEVSGESGVPENLLTAKSVSQAAKAVAEDSVFRTSFTSALISMFVEAVEVEVNHENPPLSRAYLEANMRVRVELLKHFNFVTMIRSHRLRIVAHRGREIVQRIFQAIVANPELLPDRNLNVFESLKGDERAQRRCICDYVACLTDREAVDLYARLQSERHTTIFRPVN